MATLAAARLWHQPSMAGVGSWRNASYSAAAWRRPSRGWRWRLAAVGYRLFHPFNVARNAGAAAGGSGWRQPRPILSVISFVAGWRRKCYSASSAGGVCQYRLCVSAMLNEAYLGPSAIAKMT